MMITKGSSAAYGAKRWLHGEPNHPDVANTGALSRKANAMTNETAATDASVKTSSTLSVGMTQRGARAAARTAVASVAVFVRTASITAEIYTQRSVNNSRYVRPRFKCTINVNVHNGNTELSLE